MKDRRSKYMVLTTVLITIFVLCGSVLAYMFSRTDYRNNIFTRGKVSCEVVENFDGEQKTSIKVRNTGNIDEYLRVKFVSYWVDESGNVVAKPSEMPEITAASGWIRGSSNVFYYESPIKPEDATPELLSAPIVLRTEDGCVQVLEVFAEAIQSEPVNAITEAWGATVDGSGKITALN